MTSASSSVRALLVYALILPMALIMGYLLASPGELGTWAMVAMVLLVLCTPIILAKHHAVLFLSWNMTATAFFLPGRPAFWLLMAGVSLFISVFQRALSKEMRFISVPSLVWPLFYLGFIILLTARLTGGIGLQILGSGNIGGRHYITLLAAIAGFLAMIAQRIPQEKALRYAGLFFLGGLLNAISTLAPLLGPNFYFIFLFFPSDVIGVVETGFDASIIRLWGSSVAAMGWFFYLLARYGVREMLSFSKPSRPLLLLALVAIGSSGGFRTFFILMLVTFVVLFWLEGLLQSKYAMTFGASLVLFCAVLVPLANKLPLSIQRALSVLPLNISPIARYDAWASSEWRLDMWRVLLPEVPKYLWLGKGLGISRAEMDLATEMSRRGRISSQEVSMLAGDYHSGPLSLIIPFGIWGAVGFLWFIVASFRALVLNYRYGDEALKKLNRFLIAYFLARLFVFLFIFGGFYGDLANFAGIVGLSVALNHGIRKSVREPVVKPVQEEEPLEIPGATAAALMRSQ